MIDMLNRILHKKHKAPIPKNLVCMAFWAFMALSIHALAGPPEKTVFSLNQLPSELKPYAIALGQRLQKPGKERITAIGNISYPSEAVERTEQVHIEWQYPSKVRLDQGANSLIFDRNNPAQQILKDQKTSKTIQMLLEDSVEGFFAIQKDRISRRYLGSGFSLEGASTSEPGMDVMVISYPDVFRHKQPILKSYWFDSRTKLLGVVAYTFPTGVLTHIVIDDWRDVDGEKIPFRLERWENNKLTMRLNLDSAAVSAGAEDGILGGN